MRQTTARLSVLLFLLVATITLLFPARELPAQDTSLQRVYLPILVDGRVGSQVFGIEMASLSATNGLDLVATSGTRWVRRNALLWSDIQAAEGAAYNWDAPAVKALEEEMLRASKLGINLIITVRGSPTWAVAPYRAGCAPINPSYYDDFARFMSAVVQRYSAAPYNVRYWEIGNEPDAPVATDPVVPFGCWGIVSDPFYGGRAYGEMLKVVYPAMKAANSSVSVLNGGLLLDRPYEEGKSNTTIGRFFEGMLVAGAGSSFDILSFHSYVYWYAPGLPPLGPREDWRVGYLKELLARYKAPQKPMIRSETALLCFEVTPECRWAQADLVGRTYARTLRDGLLATVWYIYDSDSFHNTAMIEPFDVFVPRAAYFAYRHTARMLSGAQYVGPIPDLPATAEGYVFHRGNETIYTFWTDERGGVPVSIAVPGGKLTCTDRDGGPVACAAENGRVALTAGLSPAFVSVRP